MGRISEQVEGARAGTNELVICRLASGWVVAGETQILPGYCLLLPDPVVASLNDLEGTVRDRFLSDMARIGDVVLRATGAARINYEILGNVEPELHAHVIPRYADEPDERRRTTVWFHDWGAAPAFSRDAHGALFQEIRRLLEPGH